MFVDLTSKQEALAQNPANDCRYYRHLREVLLDFRQRQQNGEDEPSWKKWSEFTVQDKEGREVTVLYNPEWVLKSSVHFEFFTPEGYVSHFLLSKDIPNQDIRRYAAQFLAGTPEKAMVQLEPVKKPVMDYHHWRPLFAIMNQN